MAQHEEVLVALARDTALLLTGSRRGEVWTVPSSPGDGIWVVTQAQGADPDSLRWVGWRRAPEHDILAYQRFVIALFDDAP